MGLSEEGMQPFHLGGDMVVCNGEIYGFRKLRAQLAAKYTFRSESDCEILLPLYREYGLEMFKMLDAEFAMILYDAQKDSLIAARDPIGIRPLFYGYLETTAASSLPARPRTSSACASGIVPLPSGPLLLPTASSSATPTCTTVTQYCRGRSGYRLPHHPRKARSPAWKSGWTPTRRSGFLLSGGLDSSLVCAIVGQASWTSRSARLPSAWIPTPST